jgi:Predicted signal-transduction protein containing cAMP-binding and CBS domains
MAKEILNDARFAKAGDVMTKYVFYIDGDKSVAEAIRLMRAENLSSLIVNGKTPTDPWGIVTRKDVVSKIVAPDKDPEKVKVSEIESRPLITVSPDLLVKDCAQLMRTKGIRRVAVYDGKAIVGLLSNTDIFHVIKV